MSRAAIAAVGPAGPADRRELPHPVTNGRRARIGHRGRRDVGGHGEVPDVSVVICAHTEKRWDDTLAAVASVRAQTLAARETILVVDHNPVLYKRLKSALAGVTVVENREAAEASRAARTPASPLPAARSSRSSTTTRLRSRTG